MPKIQIKEQEFTMIYHSPRFYYRFDKPFIDSLLVKVSPEHQREVSETYGNLYRHHHNRKEYQLARENANAYLEKFVQEHATWQHQKHGSIQQCEVKPSANDNVIDWVETRIEKARGKQRKFQARIDLGD